MPDSRARGFSILELLLTLAIVLCLAAFLAPSVRPATDKLKQVKALTECRRLGDAMFAWSVVQGGVPTPTIENGTIAMAAYNEIKPGFLAELLIPNYVTRVPKLDPWGRPYRYYLDFDDPAGPDAVACWSGGSDGGEPESYYEIGSFSPADKAADILWADGEFLRWPE